MKKRKNNTFYHKAAWGILFFCILLLILIYIVSIYLPDEPIIFGEEAIDFCSVYCDGSNNVMASLKNDTYGVIKCTCVEEVQGVHSKIYASSVQLKTNKLYFDSESLVPITKEDYLKRISE